MLGKRGMLPSPLVHSALHAVRRYVARQEEDHGKKTFQEEYLELLNQSGIAVDSRYLWRFRPPPAGAEWFVDSMTRGSQKTLTPG